VTPSIRSRSRDRPGRFSVSVWLEDVLVVARMVAARVRDVAGVPGDAHDLGGSRPLDAVSGGGDEVAVHRVGHGRARNASPGHEPQPCRGRALNHNHRRIEARRRSASNCDKPLSVQKNKGKNIQNRYLEWAARLLFRDRVASSRSARSSGNQAAADGRGAVSAVGDRPTVIRAEPGGACYGSATRPSVLPLASVKKPTRSPSSLTPLIAVELAPLMFTLVYLPSHQVKPWVTAALPVPVV
jgi:hypothetical protein